MDLDAAERSWRGLLASWGAPSLGVIRVRASVSDQLGAHTAWRLPPLSDHFLLRLDSAL